MRPNSVKALTDYVSLAGAVALQGERTVGNAVVPLIPVWVSQGTYTAGQIVQYNGQEYQAKTGHTGVATLPGADATNWAAVNLTCARIWFGAPTAAHTKAGTNAGTIIIGTVNGTGNKSGGIPLANDNAAGFYYPINDPLAVYLTGSNASDSVEYQIFLQD